MSVEEAAGGATAHQAIMQDALPRDRGTFNGRKTFKQTVARRFHETFGEIAEGPASSTVLARFELR